MSRIAINGIGCPSQTALLSITLLEATFPTIGQENQKIKTSSQRSSLNTTIAPMQKRQGAGMDERNGT
jgi:hypothetical protein